MDLTVLFPQRCSSKQCCGSVSVFRIFLDPYSEYGSGSTILVVTKDLTSGGGLSNGIWSKHGLRSLHLPIQANNLDVDSPHGACFSMIVCGGGGGGSLHDAKLQLFS